MQLRCEKKSPVPIYATGIDDARLREWVQLSKVEIGGVAKIADEGAFLRLYDPVLLPQEVSATDVNIDPTAIHNWLKATLGAFTTPLPYANFALWHSHGPMDVFFSSDDEKWISNFVTRGWLASVVFNRQGKTKARVDSLVGAEVEQAALWAHFDATYDVIHERYDVAAACKASYEELVKAKAMPTFKFTDTRQRERQKGGLNPGWESVDPADQPYGSKGVDDLFELDDNDWWRGSRGLLDDPRNVDGSITRKPKHPAPDPEYMRLARAVAKRRRKGGAQVIAVFQTTGETVITCNGLVVSTLHSISTAVPFVVTAIGIPAKECAALHKSGITVVGKGNRYEMRWGDKVVFNGKGEGK